MLLLKDMTAVVSSSGKTITPQFVKICLRGYHGSCVCVFHARVYLTVVSVCVFRARVYLIVVSGCVC